MYLCAHIEFGKVEHCLNYMISQQFVNARQYAQAYPLQICYTQWQEQGKKANCVTWGHNANHIYRKNIMHNVGGLTEE